MSQITIRELRKEDLTRGFLETLDALRETSSIEQNKAEEVFERIRANPEHVIIVAEMDGRVVGTTTLLIEQKFIHDGGLVGHIEDVAVDKKFQNKKIGKRIIKFALGNAKSKGCYKTILNCAEEVKPFYENMGFKSNSKEMRFDHI